MLQPGQDFPTEEMSSISQLAASYVTVTTGGYNVSTTTEPSSPDETSTQTPPSKSSGEVAGVIIGSMATFAIAMIIFVLVIQSCHRKRNKLETRVENVTKPLDTDRECSIDGSMPLPGSPATTEKCYPSFGPLQTPIVQPESRHPSDLSARHELVGSPTSHEMG